MAIRRLALFRGALLRHSDSVRVAFVAAAVFMAGPAAAWAQNPFSTFLLANVTPLAIGHDAAGNIFVVGNVNDSPIPGQAVAFVAARFDPNAATTAYFLYYPGGRGVSVAEALAVDPQGNAYITGWTGSSDFPVTSGFSGPVPSGTAYPFVVKLNPNGAVVFATLFAGAVSAFPRAIAVDSAGDVLVSGGARPGYPATPGAISVAGQDEETGLEPFVTKLDPSGTQVLFSAVGVGGSQIALGPQGDIWVAGNTHSFSPPSYPTTSGAFQTTFTPAESCTTGSPMPLCFLADEQYVTRLSSDGAKLIYSTFLTGSSGASNSGLAVDSAGNAYVTGTTGSTDYPLTTAPGTGDRPGFFLTKLDATGAGVVWSVQQGGNLLALDASGNPSVSGDLYSPAPNAPPLETNPPPPETGNTPAGCLPNGTTVLSIVYLQRFNAQDGSTAATQLMTAAHATTGAMAVEPDGRVLLAGYTYFPDVPLSPGVVFDQAVTQRTVPGTYLAAFDLSQTAIGPQLGCVTDSATIAPIGPVAPGQLLTLLGYELGPQAGVSGFAAGQASLPASLANVQVTFDGIPAPLLYVSAGQINVQVPFEVAQEAVTVMSVLIAPDSTGAYATVATRMFAVAASSPSMFLDTSVSPASCDPRLDGSVVFAAVALNGDGSPNGCGNPAKPGSVVTVFLNGVAAMLGGSFPATGSITGSSVDPFGSQVDVRGGADSLAAGPLYPAPGTIAGVDQLSIQLPMATAPGLQEVYLEMAINGIVAAPFAWDGATLYQTPVIVWVKQ